MKKIILLLLLVTSILGYGQIPDPIPNTYVNDLTGTLRPGEVRSLNETILSIEKKSSVQIAIVLINDLPANYEIEDYAREVGRRWHVGNAKNGLVYIAAVNQHKQRLEVASELEGDIPDIIAKEITDNLKPNFKNKDYFGGLQVLLSGINERIDPVIKEQKRLAEIVQEKKNKETADALITVFIWIVAIASFGLALWYFVFYPIQKRKRKEREELEEKERKDREKQREKTMSSYYERYRQNAASKSGISRKITPKSETAYIPPIIPLPNNDDTYNRSSYSSSSSSDSGSSSSSDYGNWGSGSDSSSSSDSGFSGGGSSNDW